MKIAVDKPTTFSYQNLKAR